MDFEAIFAKSPPLPSIPKVVQDLIETFNHDDFDMDEIATKISMDPVLTAKVLRLANSAHYGVSRTIGSTSEAAVLLGFSTLRTLVLASGISGAIKTPPDFDRVGYWHDNFAVAAIARWLAPYCGINGETAFTAGMLHSIGELILQLVLPEEAKKVEKAIQFGGKRLDLENAMLGYNYAEIGAELAKRWKFPDDIVNGICQHPKPLNYDPISPLAGLLHISCYIHESHKQKLSDDEIAEDFPMTVAHAIDMDAVNAKADIEQLHDVESGMDSLFMV